MGQCYAHEQLKCYDAAAKCYRRAVTSGDHENIVLHKLAELYKIMKQYDAAFSCYKQNLEYIDQQNASGQVRGPPAAPWTDSLGGCEGATPPALFVDRPSLSAPSDSCR